MELNRKNIRAILGIVTFTVVLLTAAWNLGAVWDALRTVLRLSGFFITGLSIAFILNTILDFVENHLFGFLNKRLGKRWQKVRRGISVLLTMLFIVSALFLVVFMVIPELARTFVILGEQAPMFWEEAGAWIAGLTETSGRSLDAWNLPQLDWVKIGDATLGWLQNGVGNLLWGTFSMATSLFAGIINLVVGFVVAVYVLYRKERLSNQIQRALYAFLPEPRVDRLLVIGRLTHRTFRSFISCQLLEAILLGSLCFMGMSVFGFPFAPMVSILVGVSSFVPIFGAVIGAIVGAFMILVNQGVMQTLWFLAFLFVLQQIEGNLIYPRVAAKRLMLPSLWVLVAVTLGGNMAGIMGMLVSVPTASVLYALFKEEVNRRNALRNPKEDADA